MGDIKRIAPSTDRTQEYEQLRFQVIELSAQVEYLSETVTELLSLVRKNNLRDGCNDGFVMKAPSDVDLDWNLAIDLRPSTLDPGGTLSHIYSAYKERVSSMKQGSDLYDSDDIG